MNVSINEIASFKKMVVNQTLSQASIVFHKYKINPQLSQKQNKIL